jgi:hypothetical protein
MAGYDELKLFSETLVKTLDKLRGELRLATYNECILLHDTPFRVVGG